MYRNNLSRSWLLNNNLCCSSRRKRTTSFSCCKLKTRKIYQSLGESLICRLTSCRRNSKLHSIATDKRWSKLIIWRSELPSSRRNWKMCRENSLSLGKITLFSTKDSLKSSSPLKNYRLCQKMLKGKRTKWKWKSMSCLILRLKSPGPLTLFRCSFVILRLVNDLCRRKYLISHRTSLTFKHTLPSSKSVCLTQISMPCIYRTHYHLNKLKSHKTSISSRTKTTDNPT